MFKKLYKIFGLINNNYKTGFFVITALSILIALIDTSLVIVISFIFDFLIDYKFDLYPNINNYEYSTLLVIFTSIILINLVLNIFINWFQVYYIQLLGIEFSTRILRNFFKLSFTETTDFPLSKLTKETIQDTQRIVTGIVYPFILAISKFFLFIFIGIVMLKYDAKIFLIIITIFITIYLLIFQILKNKLYNHGNVITRINKIRYSIINDLKNGFIQLKISNTYQSLIDNFFDTSKKMALSTALGQVMTQTPRFFLDTLIFLTLIALMIFMINSKSVNPTILNILVIYASATYRLLPAFSSIYTSLSTIQNNLASFDEINFETLKKEKEIITKTDENFSNIEDLSIKNLSFGYNNHNSIISNLELKLKKNDILGIHGDVGVGKSTIIKIILGLIKPNQGEFYINSKLVEIFENNYWFEKFSYVDQKYLIFDVSIIDNITLNFLKKNYQNNSMNDKKINDLINNFDLGDLFKRYDLNKKYEDLDSMLSGGQKQIISLLRGIYNEKEIICLDEPTNNLDFNFKEKIISILLSIKDKIVIIVTHDKLLLDICTQKIEIKK